ncbi:MAG: glycerophosphodiester phosphodiesterase [Candidatus Solibacter usitatus]|nr:glycerophosphodiester phosphodiesterase [Candidatus Solibacter usitatus]
MAARILVHGHRGARAMRPENTVAAFAYAIELGVDAIEMDLAVTKDDVLVVSHDPELNREICSAPAGSPGAIRQLTLAQLELWDCGSLRNPRFPRQQNVPGARIPSLDQVLALASRGAFLFNIEMKLFRERPELTPSPQRFAELLLAAIRRHQLEERVIVQSFDFRALLAMHGLAREIPLSALDETGLGDFVSVARSAGAGMISPHYRLVTAEKVAAAHAASVQVIPWTANSPEVWDALIAAGVDAIITDDPAALIAHLRHKGLR